MRESDLIEGIQLDFPDWCSKLSRRKISTMDAYHMIESLRNNENYGFPASIADGIYHCGYIATLKVLGDALLDMSLDGIETATVGDVIKETQFLFEIKISNLVTDLESITRSAYMRVIEDFNDHMSARSTIRSLKKNMAEKGRYGHK